MNAPTPPDQPPSDDQPYTFDVPPDILEKLESAAYTEKILDQTSRIFEVPRELLESPRPRLPDPGIPERGDPRGHSRRRNADLGVGQPSGTPIPDSLANSPRLRKASERVGTVIILLVLVSLTFLLVEMAVKVGLWIWAM